MKPGIKQGSRLATVLLISALGLAACGSDNDNPNPAPPPGASAPPPGASAPPPAAANGVPASAGASVAAYIAYLKGLKTDETSLPVTIGGFVPPVDDTAPPTALGG